MQSLTEIEINNNGLVPTILSGDDSKESHISIYLPVDDNDNDSSIKARFYSLYNEAKELLLHSMSSKDVETYLKPVKEALENSRPISGINGFAIFRSKSKFYHTYLYEPPPELAVVASSFHIKPLIHSISAKSFCYVLSINEHYLKAFKLVDGQLRLFKSYPNPIDEDAPKASDKRGHHKKKKDIFLTYIKTVVHQLFRDANIYKEDIALVGPKVLRKRLANELREKAKADIFFESRNFSSIIAMTKNLQETMRLKNKERSNKFVKKLIKHKGNGLVTDSLKEIASAAAAGRIDRLAIDPSEQTWGLFDRSTGLIMTHEAQHSDEDDCVVDDITEEVIHHGGEVVFFKSAGEMPTYLATLRW